MAVAHRKQNSSVLQRHSDHVAAAQVLQEFMGSLPGYGMQITKMKAFGVATTKRGGLCGGERQRGWGLEAVGDRTMPGAQNTTPSPRFSMRST